jgi:hypothetical protein
MLNTSILTDHDDQEIALLEEWLPLLSAQKRAYLKGATEALLYAQGDGFPPDTDGTGSRLWPHKAPNNAG